MVALTQRKLLTGPLSTGLGYKGKGVKRPIINNCLFYTLNGTVICSTYKLRIESLDISTLRPDLATRLRTCTVTDSLHQLQTIFLEQNVQLR